MAKAQDLTVEQKLRLLFTLQGIDSKIDEIGVLKGELPMEVNDLEDEIVGLETRATNLNKTIDGYKEQIAKHANTSKEAEALILRYESQQADVKNNREYEALTKEIELQHLEIQLSEKKSRGSKALLEDKDKMLAELTSKIDTKKAELADKKVELEKIIKTTDKEETSLVKKSEKSAKQIEERLMKAYTKIRGAYRNGLAVVTVERNSCGGCFNRIPPQMQLEIGQRKKVIVCEHCGRVLVGADIMSDLVEEEQ